MSYLGIPMNKFFWLKIAFDNQEGFSKRLSISITLAN